MYANRIRGVEQSPERKGESDSEGRNKKDTADFCLGSFLQSGPSGRGKPPVDLVLALPAAAGPLL